MHLHLLQKVWRFPKTVLKRFVSDLLRILLLSNRPRRMAQAGFVLPTTVLLVLMVVLTATALTYRTVNRSQMNIAQREQVRVANVAAPAIDRAKSKIEFIFTNDTRLTSGLPTPEVLASMMLATPYTNTVDQLVPGKDPFTLPGETRLDINNDGELDNAWSFVDGNTGETVAYSILVEAEGRDTSTLSGGSNYTDVQVTSPVNIRKARALVTRTGPVAATSPSAVCSNARAEAGWQVVDSGSSSTLQKNFQINVFVPNASDVNRTLEAFEFQQSRIAERGNKWAAWFRYDLDISPGSAFTMNGAMHTDSNLFVSAPQTNSNFQAFKISSHNSCVYGKEASEITVGVGSITNTFEGQIVRGSLITNAYEADTTADTKAIFHIWDGDDKIPVTNRALTGQNDSVDGGAPGAPGKIAVNPLKLFTEDKLEPIGSGWSRDNAAWEANPIRSGGTNGAPRVFNRRMPKPFVDDLFRADNRWGPKPRYSETIANLDITNTPGLKVGASISPSLELLRNDPLGLDGFWERQAIANGLRIVVGERLELGNPRQWNFEPSRPTVDPEALSATSPRDRLYPPAGTPSRTGIGANEYRQKRSLRDNLAAVQGMVVYHYKGSGMATDGNFPTACVAFTSHPGTPQAIVDSRTFGSWTTGGTKTDFIHGKGTNGWEFNYPAAFASPTAFASQVLADKPLGIALRNLAYFAGDPNGGAPSWPAVQDNNVHPFPHQAMWGDYSNLRRIISAGGLNTAATFDALSPADKATVHSAACTLSLLAYNLDKETSDYLDLWNQDFSSLTNVTGRFGTLIGGISRYMMSGVMAPQFKVGGKSLATLLGERSPSLTRAAWWTRQESTIKAFLTSNSAVATNLGITNVNNITADVFDVYFTAANGIYPGAAADYFNSFTFEDWLAVAPYVTGGVSAADLETMKNFSDQVNQFNSIIRDRDLGFKPGLTKKDVYINAASREIIWDEATKWTEPVDIKTGVKDDPNLDVPANVFFDIVQKVDNPASANPVPLFDANGKPILQVVRLRKNQDDVFGTESVVNGVTYFTFTINPRTYRLYIEEVRIDDPNSSDPAKTILAEYLIKDANKQNSSGQDVLVSRIGAGLRFKTNCDPNIFRSLGPGGVGGDNNVAVGGLLGCSARNKMPVRTPALFYLFPLQNHDLLATNLTAEFRQPADNSATTTVVEGEEYINRVNAYLPSTDPTKTSCSSNPALCAFKVVKSSTTNDDRTNILGVADIAAVPKPTPSSTAPTGWVLPVATTTTTPRLDTTSIHSAPFRINLPNGTTGADVAILDKGIFDGREQLAIRVADLNMAVLTSTDVVSGEKWIPDTQCIPSATVNCNLSSEGIVYAFREDAVREDEIVRPKNTNALITGTTSNNCLTLANITSANCRMVTTPGSEQDPPLTAAGISLKPVDYHADPDRRPHGFRLRNGADMSNGKDRKVGMTFVTDNSVYIMGDFNLHFGSVKYKDASGTEITEGTEKVMEEFRATVGDKNWTVANFYTDRTEQGNGGLNLNFAREGTDTWRPVEILSDAFTILSNDFVDGSVEDTFIIKRPNDQSATNLAATTSYTNQSRPNEAQTLMVRENDATSPIWFNRNGSAFVGTSPTFVAIETATATNTGNTTLNWTVLTDSDDVRRRNLNLVTSPVRVNAVLIGGLVPSRPNQGYGGLNNFPRLIQNWGGANSTTQQPLIIGGSFLQLNFSTASTGPFEQDAWEPGATPTTDERLGFYSPSTRRWGYDPALLYYPPAAASRRFASVGNLRSEYFRDLPADDPYVQLLRCAEDGSGNKIFDATIQGGLCPA